MSRRKLILLSFGLLLLLATIAYFLVPQLFVSPLVALNRSLSGLSEHVVTVDRHEIHYLDGGRGDTVLLLHGIFAEKDHWVEFARSLTPHYRVIALDIPGFGESSRLASHSYEYADQVRLLEEFVEQLGLQHVHLAGSSMGGTIAALYAIKFPERVRSVAFIGAPPGIRSPQASEMDRRMAAGEIPLIARTPIEFDRMMTMVFVKRPFMPYPILQDASDKAVSLATSNVRLWDSQRRDAYLLEEQLPALAARTLTLWGDGDNIFNVSGVETIRRLLPMQEVHVLRGVGHLPMMERPRETASLYEVFLKKQP
jgi:pimeloyl-ACP methyl ester carboxylesterase